MKRPSRRKHHIIYKTTCLVTGRYYIGMHSTDDLEDGYLGSGVHLTRSVKKYGKDQHVREILEQLPDRDSLKKREEELITEDLVRNDVLCMNLIRGGGGNDREYGFTDKTLVLISTALKMHYASEHGRETKQRLRETQLGRARSEETRAKMSTALKGKPKSDEHRASMSRERKGRLQSPERRARTRTGRERPCTLDGVKIYSSHSALVREHGHGKQGGRSPNLRYLDV